MSEEMLFNAFAAGMAGGLLLAIALTIRALWRKVTDPEAARRLGSRVRSSIDGAANAAGQASGTMETLAKSAVKSYSDGRISKKGRDTGSGSSDGA